MKITDKIVEQIYAGWLGKAVGIRYGAPVEMWSAEQIAEKFAGKEGYFVDYRDFAADECTTSVWKVEVLSCRHLTPIQAITPALRGNRDRACGHGGARAPHGHGRYAGLQPQEKNEG